MNALPREPAGVDTRDAELASLKREHAELLRMLQLHLDWYDGKYQPLVEGAFIGETRVVLARAKGAT